MNLHGWSISDAIQFSTINPATFLEFNTKGRVEQFYDADLLIFNDKMEVQYVIAKGKILKTPNYTHHDMFPCV